MMTIYGFCEQCNASEAAEAAMSACTDMQQVWQTATPGNLIWIATRPGVLTGKELRLFAAFCAGQVAHLITDEVVWTPWGSPQGIWKTAATASASANAKKAAQAAAGSDPQLAAVQAADFAAMAFAMENRDMTWAAAFAAASEAQVKWLRENTKPNFEEVE